MKMIVAIIRPEKLEDVQTALSKVEVYLMTASDVRGCGRQRQRMRDPDTARIGFLRPAACALPDPFTGN